MKNGYFRRGLFKMVLTGNCGSNVTFLSTRVIIFILQ